MGKTGVEFQRPAKPTLSITTPGPEAFPPQRLASCVANQINSLQDYSLIPCQRKSSAVKQQKKQADSGFAPGLVSEANTAVLCAQVPQRPPSTYERLKDFWWPWHSCFNEGLGQLVSRTQLRVSGHRLPPRKQKFSK